MKIYLSIPLAAMLLLTNPCRSQEKSLKEIETTLGIDEFRASTVSIGIIQTATYTSEDKRVTKKIFNPIGTGMLFYISVNGKLIPCIITAKHVLSSQKVVSVRFSSHDSLSIDRFFGTEMELSNGKTQNWIAHPDSTVDLACILMDPTFKWPLKSFPVIAYSTFATEPEYFEGKEIYTLGYPAAVGIDLLNKAFLRKGIIAWVPRNLFSSQQKVVIDCNIFPGNSGGPVFSVSDILSKAEPGSYKLQPRFYGIVIQRRFSYNPILSDNGSFKDSRGAIVYSQESTGVGVIIPANKVKELLNFASTVVLSALKK